MNILLFNKLFSNLLNNLKNSLLCTIFLSAPLLFKYFNNLTGYLGFMNILFSFTIFFHVSSSYSNIVLFNDKI